MSDKLSDVERLRTACLYHVNDKDLEPYWVDKNWKRVPKGPNTTLLTFCNFSVSRICNYMGFSVFLSRKMLANQIYGYCEKHFEKLTPEEAHKRANRGQLVVAALPGKPHGHVAVVAVSQAMIYSGKWKLYSPQIANVGTRNGVFGSNWAFGKPPDYFLVKKEEK